MESGNGSFLVRPGSHVQKMCRKSNLAGARTAQMGNGSDASEFHSSISKTSDIVLGVVYSLFGLFSISGNSMLLLVAYRKRSILKPAEFFIINLAVSDLGMTGTLFPLAIPSLFAHRWLFDWLTCKYYAFCGVLFGLCSLTNLTVLSSVCCMKVCYPLYGNKYSFSHSRILLLCVWAYAFVFATAPLVDWGSYGPEPYGTACCIDWKAANQEHRTISYIVSLFVFCYIIPSTLILISYTLILLTVKGARKAVQQHLSLQNKGSVIHTLLIKLSVAVCIGFFLAWTPYAVVAMLAAFGDANDVPPIVFALAAMFAKSSTLYNPVVYLLLKPNFLNVITKDLSVFQAVCAVGCCRCRKQGTRVQCLQDNAGVQTKLSSHFMERPCTRSDCMDAFECISTYPQCCNLDSTDTNQPVHFTLVKNPAGNMESPTSVHLVVYSSRAKSKTEAIEVSAGAIQPDCIKDFL
ncbi:opsin-5-like isoform X3 [Hyla sarda]|uniref:opsin-5-like isoform X3 n=1 Tax=Hyla sarda TaxID=327740 RepID=UPI0024C41141|nr:opsin-5-like isoform X3 [Hyla sarda]